MRCVRIFFKFNFAFRFAIVFFAACALISCHSKAPSADLSLLGEKIHPFGLKVPALEMAPMIDLKDGSGLFFQLEKNLDIIHFHPESNTLELVQTIENFPSEQECRRHCYQSVNTPAGIWLIGPSIELIKPNHQRISGMLKQPNHTSIVGALNDGSILVRTNKEPNNFYYLEPAQLERIRLAEDGSIRSEMVAPDPACTNAECAPLNLNTYQSVALSDGSILFDSISERTAFIFNPINNKWQRIPGSVGHDADFYAFALLPDGRIFSANGTSTILWDPKTQQWTAGPKLPVPVYGAQIRIANQKTVILAGGDFPGVLTWDIGAPNWIIAATLEKARQNAQLLLTRENKLLLIRGVHKAPPELKQVEATEGWSEIGFGAGGTRKGDAIGKTSLNHAEATRNGKTLIAGGARGMENDSRGDGVPTSSVELVDETTHQVNSLAPLPFATKHARAFWLDDQRIVLLCLDDAQRSNTVKIFLFNMATQVFSQLADIFPAKTYGGAEKLTPDFETTNIKLEGGVTPKHFDFVGEADNKLYFTVNKTYLVEIAISSPSSTVSTDTNKTPSANTATTSGVTWLDLRRAKAQAKIINDGKIIITGAEETNMVLTRVLRCPQCPEEYREYTSQILFSSYALVDYKQKTVINSPPSKALGGPIAVLPSGRVLVLGAMTQRLPYTPTAPANGPQIRLALELSNSVSESWKPLPLPTEITVQFKAEDLRLSPINSTDHQLDAVVLLGILNSDTWWWMDVAEPSPSWHLMASQKKATEPTAGTTFLGSIELGSKRWKLLANDDGIFAEPQ